MAHKRFNFKSSGTKITNRKFTDPVVIEKPIGIKTPLEFGIGEDDIFSMHTNPAKQVGDNLRNLISTNFGERLGRANFGANLVDLTFEYGATDKFEAEAMLRINEIASRHISVISIRQVSVLDYLNSSDFRPGNASGDSFGLALVSLRIKYDIPKIKVFNQAVDALIYVGG